MNATPNGNGDVNSGSGPCFRLIYRSHSRLSGESENCDAGLAALLNTARSNNRKKDITGALVLYREKGLFAQVLEGDEDIVRPLFDRIKADPRHEKVDLREAEGVPERLFGQWAMALVAEHHEPDKPVIAAKGGLSEAAPWRVTEDQERVLTLLRDITRGYGKSY